LCVLTKIIFTGGITLQQTWKSLRDCSPDSYKKKCKYGPGASRKAKERNVSSEQLSLKKAL
jgi:hypothetical protein